MNNILKVEFRKVLLSKILWLPFSGALLPPIIALLMLNEKGAFRWEDYLHVAMFIFNLQSLLTYSALSSNIWAREYDENTMELSLCYPYPKYYLLIAKLLVVFTIIAITTVLFLIGSTIFGLCYFRVSVNISTILLISKILGFVIIMHSLLQPFVFLLTIITKNFLSGIVLGVFTLISTSMIVFSKFIQYIPFYIPFVMSDNMFGYKSTYVSSFTVQWVILIIYFIFSFISCLIILRKKWELAY
jgi:ABC-type transport system involved in multi-copper enzyme maturation permease subunit